MYYIYGLNYDGRALKLECLLTEPISGSITAKSKYRKAVKLSAQGLSAGLYDSDSGKWISVCQNGKKNSKMTNYLNDRGFRPSGSSYFVANTGI